MQVDPIKPTLKAPGTKHFKLQCDELLSSFAFKFDLRRYAKAEEEVLRSEERVRVLRKRNAAAEGRSRAAEKERDAAVEAAAGERQQLLMEMEIKEEVRPGS